MWLHIEGDNTPQFDHNGYVIGTEAVIFLSLVFVADQVGLNLVLSETPKLGFLTSWPICTGPLKKFFH